MVYSRGTNTSNGGGGKVGVGEGVGVGVTVGDGADVRVAGIFVSVGRSSDPEDDPAGADPEQAVRIQIARQMHR